VAEPDRWDPQIKHALGRVAERENRVLRVIYNASVNPLRVITGDMRIRYDQKIDALYLRLDDSKAVVPAADLEQLRLLVA
jgi:hypothetical protein